MKTKVYVYSISRNKDLENYVNYKVREGKLPTNKEDRGFWEVVEDLHDNSYIFNCRFSLLLITKILTNLLSVGILYRILIPREGISYDLKFSKAREIGFVISDNIIEVN